MLFKTTFRERACTNIKERQNMAINKVNTRVILKNDELSNWLSADSIVLKKGELAFAKMQNGKYEMRIGQNG